MTRSKHIPTRELARVAWYRLLREWRAQTAPRQPQPLIVGGSKRDIAGRIRERHRPHFFSLDPAQVDLIRRFFPEESERIVAAAERILTHEFDLLGSGPIRLGNPIDWHTDFKTGHTWPLEHHARLKLVDLDAPHDIKVPWELSRFHHAITLGQAYLLTGDERYVREIISQVRNWIQANPYLFGVNWAGPMDVAIRAVNWLWAYHLVRTSNALETDFLALWLSSLERHGHYLLGHLEDTWPRSNHLIANLTGLAYLGILLPEFRGAARWQRVGLTRLWDEVRYQVGDDGMHYEASTGYHHLVTEMVLSVVALCIINDIEVPEDVLHRLDLMLDAIMCYTQPDGTAPQIGDADDGRLHPLSIPAYPSRGVNDHRHLLALGSLVLEREAREWAGFADPYVRGWSLAAGDQWLDAFWCFPADAAARLSDVMTLTVARPEGAHDDDWVEVRPDLRLRAKALPVKSIVPGEMISSVGLGESGLYVMRHGGLHMTIDAGPVGQDGAGGHAHNDTLSITLHAHGQPMLVDPGTYVYTADVEQRNLFRSTACHNTLMVDGQEINRIPEEQPFRLMDDAKVTVRRWESNGERDLLDASHDGYRRFERPVTHRRQVWFDKQAGLWLLRDLLTGQGEHEVALHFHFAPLSGQATGLHDHLRLDPVSQAVVYPATNGGSLIILPLQPFSLRATLLDGWVSLRYGVRTPAPLARFAGRVKLPARFTLVLFPHKGPVEIERIRQAGLRALAALNNETSLF
jgi:hypothetical protein